MDLSVYVITADVPDLNRTHLDVAKEAILGGATVIQFREKRRETREMLEIGSSLRKLTREAGIPLIVNDRIDVALVIQADGVHVGQDDMPLEEVKRLVPDHMVIGVSATNLEEAIVAQEGGASYLGVGPVFPTPSKDDAAEPMGMDKLAEIREKISIPIVAIGGITLENLKEVLSTGIDGVAVISAVACAASMREATRELYRRIVGPRQGASATMKTTDR
ncbi:MAG: thiamine phosphate synthase [Actinomycetota bacterium]